LLAGLNPEAFLGDSTTMQGGESYMVKVPPTPRRLNLEHQGKSHPAPLAEW
jgi:hypothetical protein